MARAAAATKQKKKPADFKRPKRKVGRRAAPAANVTSVGITSRRINLLEQSLLQDKAHAAQLTHRRQALPELLQQVGHYNGHVRQKALQGLRELAGQETAANLRANASVLLERFLPTLLDEEAVDALRAIDALVDEAPELLREDAGREALARLLENFRDLICAAQTQGIRMMNSYDLLLGEEPKSGKKAVNGHKSQKTSQKGKQMKAKKPKAPSGALALRLAALKVLHKLLKSVSTEHRDGSSAGVGSARSTSAPMTKTLLLYPEPQLIASGMFSTAPTTTSAGVKATASWQVKVRALLPALLELWLECLEGSVDTLSDGHVEHMMYIVECTAIVVSANTDLLTATSTSNGGDDEFFVAALKLREELLAPESFPMLPSASESLAAASESLGVLSRWHGMNAALAKLACEYLRVPSLLCGLGKEVSPSESLEKRIQEYVVLTLAKYTVTTELRAVAKPQQMELGRRSLFALISVLKQLPTEWAAGDQMDGVLTNLAAFFDLAAEPSTSAAKKSEQKVLARTRFDALGAADQLSFVALVYHVPRYPVSLLRALASCCKSPRICSEGKSFLVDILFQRREALDLAHFVSFLVSTALAPVNPEEQQQRQQLELVNHVCRTFVAMNLGNSLPKILAPTLAKAQAREGLSPVELHTLVMLYRTCVISSSSCNEELQHQRSDIPVEMERELVGLSAKVLVEYSASSSPQKVSEQVVSREQERLLSEACVSTLALSEVNIFASFLDELLLPQQPLALGRRLRVLQALVRTTDLVGAFRRHQNHVTQLLHKLEQQYTGEDDVAKIVRQLRGDLELLAVGQLTEDSSVSMN
ncbi:hypothetical protein JM18_007200 [Phytophthora kernoviae]|uniref:TEX10-like TPR repeats domain-containing protein n=2 Tax=Phytophthora kernoviae TaxID=325452 RepID=A0A8T0LNF7_9STRA|nr:hypothetical protein G195_009033 [Phytophthora kernoviae 00238/432]KAG2508800.1 hypothetical protein JM16_008701 [Phytophthora kernoviae]KAG2517403.1 hypothetical protein JM18_007200 [Phytophthora kernoviae]